MSKNLTTALCTEKKKKKKKKQKENFLDEKKNIKNAKITNVLMLEKATQVPAMMKF